MHFTALRSQTMKINEIKMKLKVKYCADVLRSAFAELQIDMSEVTNDILASSGLPFREYGDYSVRVLFANDRWPCYFTPEYVS